MYITYKNFLPINEEGICEKIPLMEINMNNGINNVVNIKIFLKFKG